MLRVFEGDRIESHRDRRLGVAPHHRGARLQEVQVQQKLANPQRVYPLVRAYRTAKDGADRSGVKSCFATSRIGCDCVHVTCSLTLRVRGSGTVGFSFFKEVLVRPHTFAHTKIKPLSRPGTTGSPPTPIGRSPRRGHQRLARLTCHVSTGGGAPSLLLEDSSWWRMKEE